MKTISRQFLCLMLALCLCITAIPVPALATEGQTPEDAAQSTPQQTETEGVDTETLPAEDPVDPGADPPQQEPDTTDPEPTPAPSDKTEDVEEEPAAPTPEPSDLPEGENAVEPTPAPEQPETVNPTPTPEETEPTPTPEPAPTPAAEPSPVLSDGLVEEQAADALLLGLDIEPISYAVVDEPLVKVTYHYADVQVATPTNLPTSSISAHSYHPLTRQEDGRMTSGFRSVLHTVTFTGQGCTFGVGYVNGSRKVVIGSFVGSNRASHGYFRLRVSRLRVVISVSLSDFKELVAVVSRSSCFTEEPSPRPPLSAFFRLPRLLLSASIPLALSSAFVSI